MKALRTILDKIENRSPADLTRESLVRLRRGASRARSRASDRRGSTYVSDSELAGALATRSISEAVASIRNRTLPGLIPGLRDAEKTAHLVSSLFPSSVDEARAEADRIVRHDIALFGRIHHAGPQIDWHRDPDSDATFPLLHFTRMVISPGGGADPRRVWELNRLYHLVALGRAYAFTRDERYTKEFLNQLASWNVENPPRFGINWTNAMEAGIRSVNIIAAFALFRHSPELTDDAITLLLKVLLAHARFIRSNLEYSAFGSSNHYLSDLIGLMAIGSAMPELKRARHWADFAQRRLAIELRRQVLDDGVNYEGSTAYHRFVLEISTMWLLLSRSIGTTVPTDSERRLKSMFEFVRACLKPDGSAPTIGDSDDSRLLRFKAREPRDYRYLMSIGASLYPDEQFKQSARPDEEMLWWLGESGLRKFESVPLKDHPIRSEAFSRAQIFIQRQDELYAAIDCGDHGLNGRGSHAHSDALSLELFAYGRTFLRDPGTYVYTASESRRNLFRSTAYHNTVRIDKSDISVITPGQRFSLGRNVKPRINSWESSPDRDVLDAEHHAYARLSQPVIHRRTITFDKTNGYWTVRDLFIGEGEHLFETFFNFDSGAEVTLVENNRAVASSGGASLAIVPFFDREFDARVVGRWVSPAYGTRMRSSGIIYSLRACVPIESVFLLIPFRNEDASKPERISMLADPNRAGARERN